MVIEPVKELEQKIKEYEDKLSYYKNNEIAIQDVLNKKNKEIKRLTLENIDLKEQLQALKAKNI